ncbi:hypothetical protein O1611_g6939 [Lasiodiplodia mahajangana]|uniref:Uncharacterized protein n=1 Tax=Lasiodiplodia mahajangana TaxID=1108764 RepID=A0ACC2JGS0_9PEZI|nr:hypothetical protein O1611_g6939 [Lasiodiplodia mahajangana]
MASIPLSSYRRLEETSSQDIGDQPTDAFYQDGQNGHQPSLSRVVMEDPSSTGSKSEAATLSHTENGAYTMWNSIWLQTRVLASFLALFIALFLVTIILYRVSEKNSGLSAEDAARQYGWRYGPTAFLTVVLSLWTQVDYSNKILTPWQEMRRGQTAADRSVLLEYVSPFMLTVLWRAIKRRHWAVTASILGILLIQLAVSKWPHTKTPSLRFANSTLDCIFYRSVCTGAYSVRTR